MEVYTFDPGQARTRDGLTDVEAVVAALSRALALRADICVPFPREDLSCEEHVRRLSLLLQRHGRPAGPIPRCGAPDLQDHQPPVWVDGQQRGVHGDRRPGVVGQGLA